jgi:hypothetical protein
MMVQAKPGVQPPGSKGPLWFNFAAPDRAMAADWLRDPRRAGAFSPPPIHAKIFSF